MSSRELEDADARRIDAHVAQQLGISIEALAEHPYEIDEAGHGIVWRLLWHEGPPEGVAAFGAAGTAWTDIHPLHQPDS